MWANRPLGPNPCVPETDLLAFEQSHGIRLPDGYRAFLTQVGNGGQWPWLRVQPFEGIGPLPWRQWDFGVGNLAKPFPHSQPWNDPSGEPAHPDDPDLEEEYERLHLIWSEQYFALSLVDGTIPLHDHGCGRRSWLVVNGPLAGTLWFDARVDPRGLYPLTDHDGRWLRFLEWVLLRVDAARRNLRRERTRPLSNSMDS